MIGNSKTKFQHPTQKTVNNEWNLSWQSKPNFHKKLTLNCVFYFYKGQVLWEGHKIRKNRPLYYWYWLVTSKQNWTVFNSLWSSENIWTVNRKLAKNWIWSLAFLSHVKITQFYDGWNRHPSKESSVVVYFGWESNLHKIFHNVP